MGEFKPAEMPKARTRVVDDLKKAFPQFYLMMGEERFRHMCETFTRMTECHPGLRLKDITDAINSNLAAIIQFQDTMLKRYTKAKGHAVDILELAITSCVVGKVVGVKPGVLLAIAKRESIGFIYNTETRNKDGTYNYGFFQLNFVDTNKEKKSDFAADMIDPKLAKARLASLNRTIGNKFRLETFPAEIFTPEKALDPSNAVWAAGLTLAMKRGRLANLRDALRAYNGSGPRAREYAEDVLQNALRFREDFGFDGVATPAAVPVKRIAMK